MATYYEILGIQQDATGDVIRNAYVRLIKESHPDVNLEGEDSTERARLILEAYSVLRDRKYRQEYDLFLLEKPTKSFSTLDARKKPRRAATATETKPPWVDSPPVACQNCGIENVILRQFSFAWVVSFLIETRHGQDSFVLCSRCRFIKSLIYLFRVLLLGWWAVPVGFLYTITAIFQNLFGGFSRREENAAVLASHGYWLYSNGNYNEALASFQQSNRLVPGREKYKIITQLQVVTSPPNAYQKFAKILDNLNPAWIILPGVCLIVSLGVFSSTTLQAFQQTKFAQRTLLFGLTSSSFDHDKLLAESSREHFQLARLDSDTNDCIEVIKREAVYVHDQLPMVKTRNESGTTVHEYVFDRDKLSADRLNLFSHTLHCDLTGAVKMVERIMAPSDHNHISSDLNQYCKQQIDFMRACYFNSTLLAVSVAHNNASDSLEQASSALQSIRELQTDQMMGDWISEEDQTAQLQPLIDSLNAEVRAKTIKDNISILQNNIDQSQIQVDNLTRSMDAAKSTGDFDSYNDLVPAYNADLNVVKAENEKLLGEIGLYNAIAATLNKSPVNNAFDDCTNGNILLSQFNFVNLKEIPAQKTQVN